MTTTTTKPKRSRSRRKYDGPSAEEKLCQEIIQLIESGVNPWRREWRKGAAGGHRNLITGKNYQGSNPALLECYQQARGYELPLWCGSSQARAKGWHPIKGSKCAYVVRPQANRFEDEVKNIQTGEMETVERAWMSYKPAAVFNVAELKGKDEKSQAALDRAILEAQGLVTDQPEIQRLEHAEKVFSEWQVKTKFQGDKAFYVPAADSITMPERHLWDSQSGLYATWAHECIHSTGHEKRLKREMSGRFGSKKYAREELVAELGAFLVCNRLNIGSDANNHASYLAHYAEVLREGPKVLFKVLSDATKASNLILGAEVTDND
tara:strand:+ start:73 stop:1038 length:966 start_codon:yes stop_codon:yes gene_type:complete